MVLSEEQRAALTEAAKEAGLDPAEVIAEAGKLDGAEAEAEPAGEKAAEAPAAKGEIKIFGYHLPFMTPKEIRASIGITSAIVDQDMPSGEWLAKHGGAPAAAKGEIA
jgi:hypothetical protein